jgi:hypothetical protein
MTNIKMESAQERKEGRKEEQKKTEAEEGNEDRHIVRFGC